MATVSGNRVTIVPWRRDDLRPVFPITCQNRNRLLSSRVPVIQFLSALGTLVAERLNQFCGGRVSVNAWVWFFVAVSALSLIAAWLFTRKVVASDTGIPATHGIGERMKSNLFSRRWARFAGAMATLLLLGQGAAFAAETGGGEANLTLPDLRSVNFFGMTGHALLTIGLLFCAGGLLFGLAIYVQLKNLPVHRTMREISELIYETCKTYLVTQGKFILLLWVFIAVIISLYFGYLAPVPGKSIGVTLPIILLFSLIGIAGSYGVAWFGIRVNTFANSRTAFGHYGANPIPALRFR
jgi:K(+)-stimulated pyrophosphate-energized sodium pump